MPMGVMGDVAIKLKLATEYFISKMFFVSFSDVNSDLFSWLLNVKTNPV